MKENRFILILIFLLFTSVLVQTKLYAQDHEKISGLFPGITFPRFTQQVSAMTGYRFYYSTEDLQDFQVNISAKENTLTQILDALFEQTEFKFSIDAEKRVFITKNKPLELTLAKDFFERLKTDGEADSLNRQSDIERAYSRNKLYVIGNPGDQKEATLSGKITGIETGNPVFGAVVFERVEYRRAITNEDGFFQILLPIGRHTLFIQNLGGFIEQRQISLQGDGILDVAIEENIISLSEVTVSSDRMTNISRPEMGVQKLNIHSMKKSRPFWGRWMSSVPS